jgi:hypothetical protein
MSSTTTKPAQTGAELLVKSLEAQGIEYIFGIPGAKIDKVFDTLLDSKIKTIVCRHEQNAAFLAGGIGRMTGRAGVVLVTSGPGCSNLVMNIIDGFTDNMGNIFLGNPTNFGTAIGILAFFVVVVVVVHFLTTWISLRKPRLIQNTLGAVIEVVRRALFVRIVPRLNYSKADVTPFFRVNGYPPDTQEYKDLLKNNFVNWRLKVHGLVEKPLELSVEDLRAMKKEVQITEHSCIQGWTAIGEWGGVPLSHILSLCRPLPQALCNILLISIH